MSGSGYSHGGSGYKRGGSGYGHLENVNDFNGGSGWVRVVRVFSSLLRGGQNRVLKDHNIGVYEKVRKQPGPTRTTRTQSRFLRVCGRPHTRTQPGPTYPKPGPEGSRSRRNKNHAGFEATPMGKISNVSQTAPQIGPGRAMSAGGVVPVGAIRMRRAPAHESSSVA